MPSTLLPLLRFLQADRGHFSLLSFATCTSSSSSEIPRPQCRRPTNRVQARRSAHRLRLCLRRRTSSIAITGYFQPVAAFFSSTGCQDPLARRLRQPATADSPLKRRDLLAVVPHQPRLFWIFVTARRHRVRHELANGRFQTSVGECSTIPRTIYSLRMAIVAFPSWRWLRLNFSGQTLNRTALATGCCLRVPL